MVKFVIVGAVFMCAVVARIGGATQVVTMQGTAPPPVVSPPSPPKGTGLVVGQVVDADSGRPVPGAFVRFASHMPVAQDQMLPGAISNMRSVLTNAEGRFMFHGVPAGYIGMSANASRYISASPGQRRPMGPSQPLLLIDGERVPSITIRMWRHAAIEGRVLDENNEPVVRMQVRALRREWVSGRMRLIPGAIANTDDRGAFRISQLIPGDYYVSVPTVQETVPLSVSQHYQNLIDGGGGTASTELVRRLSFSGAPSAGIGGQRIGEHVLQAGRATAGLSRPVGGGERVLVYPTAFEPQLDQEPINLNSGDERQGVDIALRPVPAVKVSGVLTGPEGPVAHVGVQLIQSRLNNATSFSGIESAMTATDASGAFTFLGIPGGSYTLRVMYVPGPPSGGASTIITSGSGTTASSTARPQGAAAVSLDPTLYAEMDLAVGDDDLAGLNVPVHVGARISGTVVFRGVAPPPTAQQVARMSINFRSVGGTGAILTPGRVDADMKIRTPGYPAGRYFLTAPSPAPGWSLASATEGARDVSRSGIELGDTDVTNLVLTFSDERTELTGTVRTRASTGDQDAVVLAVPSDLRGWVTGGMNPRLSTAVRTSPTGSYTIAGLPSGDYRVIALGEDFAPEALDPEFLNRLAQLGTTVTLREGERLTLDLRTETPPRGAPLAPSRSQDQVLGVMVRPIVADESVTGGPLVSDTLSLPQQAPARDVTSVTPRGTGVISGVVVGADEDRKPLRKVQVRVTSTQLRPARVTTTDDAGRFLFADLPAGQFTVQASRPPYVDAYYGASRPGRAGTTLVLADGQRLSGLTIPMIRGAVIEGTVWDEFGLPEEQAQVSVLQRRPGANGPLLVDVSEAAFLVTDDRGRYRAWGLLPGDYIIGVSNRFSSGEDMTRITDADMRWGTAALTPTRTGNTPPPASQAIATAPVYHPGVTDLANAAVTSVGVAEERTGVDINMVTVPAARVGGRVVAPDGQPPVQLQMNMVREGVQVVFVIPTMVVRPAADGSFQISGVVPGRYAITARAASRTQIASSPVPGRGSAAQSLDLWAMETVEIDGQDITGISLALAPGLSVRGRIVFEKTTASPPERFGGVSVRLSPTATTGVSLGVSPATVAEDGTFEFAGVPPNAYRVTVTAPGRTAGAPTWMVRSAEAGRRDVSDAPLIVTPGGDVADLVVTMTDRVTELTGLLLDGSGRPSPDLTILVFPVDKAQWGRNSRRRPPATRPGTDGRYRLPALPPGEYFMVALTEIDASEMYDVAFLESLIPAALRFTLAEGEKKVQDLKLSGR